MPGILGLIGETGETTELGTCLKAISHFEWNVSKEYRPARGVEFGAVYREEVMGDVDYFEDPGSGFSVLLYGFALMARPSPARLTAEGLLKSFKSEGFGVWDQLDGSFTCIIFDRRSSRLLIANDRLGTLPVYYAKNADLFAFAPEAKGILAHSGFTPSFDEKAVASFLTAGYCLGSQSLFDGVTVMRPASVLSLDTNSLAVQIRNYWNLKYERSSELRVMQMLRRLFTRHWWNLIV